VARGLRSLAVPFLATCRGKRRDTARVVLQAVVNRSPAPAVGRSRSKPVPANADRLFRAGDGPPQQGLDAQPKPNARPRSRTIRTRQHRGASAAQAALAAYRAGATAIEPAATIGPGARPRSKREPPDPGRQVRRRRPATISREEGASRQRRHLKISPAFWPCLDPINVFFYGPVEFLE